MWVTAHCSPEPSACPACPTYGVRANPVGAPSSRITSYPSFFSYPRPPKREIEAGFSLVCPGGEDSPGIGLATGLVPPPVVPDSPGMGLAGGLVLLPGEPGNPGMGLAAGLVPLPVAPGNPGIGLAGGLVLLPAEPDSPGMGLAGGLIWRPFLDGGFEALPRKKAAILFLFAAIMATRLAPVTPAPTPA